MCPTAHIPQQTPKFVPLNMKSLRTITEVHSCICNIISNWIIGSNKSRAATLLLMKSLEHQSNSLTSSISSTQSPASSGSAGPSSNSFNKFSRSNGYYSQVLRVSWNIIGRLDRGGNMNRICQSTSHSHTTVCKVMSGTVTRLTFNMTTFFIFAYILQINK